jgi:hypothetical protein
MSSHLSLVPAHPIEDELTKAARQHEARAQWLDSLKPNRSVVHGSAGVEALRRLGPLAPDELAHRERCEERTKRAKDEAWPVRPSIVERFKALLGVPCRS